MHLRKTLNGDWVNLDQAQSLYVAEIQGSPFAKSDGFRLGIYARFSPQQTHLLYSYEPTDDSLATKNRTWLKANADLDKLVNELKTEKAILSVETMKNPIATLDNQDINVKEVPKKRTSRKTKGADNE